MNESSKGRKRMLELLLFAAAMLLSLAVLEVGLRMFTVFPIGYESNRVAHPELGYVLNASLDDVDGDGFRNVECALGDAPVVTLGDSHTYGNNVPVGENFPSALARRLGHCVYNFGIGSYGIYQYGVLLRDLADSGVDTVLLGFYPTNDLATNDVSCSLQGLPYWQAFAAERSLALPDCADSSGPPSYTGSFIERTAAFQAIDHLLLESGLADWDGSGLVNPVTHFLIEGGPPVDKSSIRRHRRTTTLNRPNNRTNYELSKAVLLDAERRLRDASIGFAVLIIPSKERVVYEWAERNGIVRDPDFDDVVQSEMRLTGEYVAFLEESQIDHALALPQVVDAFAASLEGEEDFYRLNDGHPFAAGYAAYADAAAALLERAARQQPPSGR